MNEPLIIATAGLPAERTFATRRRIYLLALILVNWLTLCGTLVTMVSWTEFSLQWLMFGMLFSQVYLLAFWAAWRGGSLVVRMGMPFLVVVVGGLLAFDVLVSQVRRIPFEISILPVPLGIMYFLGLALLMPFRSWSGKSLVFPGEDAPSARPRQFRVHHFAAWTALIAAALALARASSAGALAQTDMAMLLLLPTMLVYMAVLSIPIVRAIFAPARRVLWSTLAFLLILAVGILWGFVGCSLLWAAIGRRIWWGEYALLFLPPLSYHAGAGLILIANLAAIGWMGGEFRGVAISRSVGRAE